MAFEYSTLSFKNSFALSLGLIFIMGIGRIALCYNLPDVIGGKAAALEGLQALLTGAPFVFFGIFCIFVRDYIRAGMAILSIGLFYWCGASVLRTQFVIFYIGRHFDFVDSNLGAIDANIGFDWTSYFEWAVNHRFIFQIFDYAYQSIWIQPVCLFIAYMWRRNLPNFMILQTSLSLSLALTCIVATLMPALGAYQFHGMTPDRHPGLALEFADGMTQPMLWLRQEQLPAVLPPFRDVRLITFPSWHAAAAIIFIMSAWSLPALRWPALALNGLMLAATPVQGSHYLTDIIVGAMVGGVSFLTLVWALQVPMPFGAGLSEIKAPPSRSSDA